MGPNQIAFGGYRVILYLFFKEGAIKDPTFIKIMKLIMYG